MGKVKKSLVEIDSIEFANYTITKVEEIKNKIIGREGWLKGMKKKKKRDAWLRGE